MSYDLMPGFYSFFFPNKTNIFLLEYYQKFCHLVLAPFNLDFQCTFLL